MARLSVSSLTLVAALVLLAGCDRESATDTQQQRAGAATESPAPRQAVSRAFAGAELPQFTASRADGATLDLAGLKGQPVLLNLWATWCAPCVAEMPILDAIAGANAGKLRVVTVSEDGKDGADKVAAFFAEHKFARLEQWLDLKQDLSISMQVGDMPTTFLYNAEGKEIARVVGAYDWEGEEAQALIAEAIGG
jgi:thiol-disulfide isomerase/thioredoxin